MQNLASLTRPSLQTGENSERAFSVFCIFGEPLIKEKSHNSRNGNDTDMKLGLVSKIDKKKKKKKKEVKKIDNDAMSGQQIVTSL